jgi:A/G-specific adenine glycosylase
VADAAVTKRDLLLVEGLLPADDEAAATASIALMELGALICTARSPRCQVCPLSDRCAWLARGRPPLAAAVKRPQSYAGTDRQVRGRLLAVLRDAEGPVGTGDLEAAWAEPIQRSRALDGLVVDGLIDPLPNGRWALPTTRAAAPGR